MTHQFSPFSLAAGIVLGALLACVWFYGGNFLPVSAGVPGAEATSTPEGSASGAVSVSDQPAGNTVIIDSVTVPPPGVWIAVREVDGSDLGNVLGAVRAGGPRLNLSVPLLRPTVAGTLYGVELYRDNGDGVFDLSTDSVYVDFDTGERVVAYFQTL